MPGLVLSTILLNKNESCLFFFFCLSIPRHSLRNNIQHRWTFLESINHCPNANLWSPLWGQRIDTLTSFPSLSEASATALNLSELFLTRKVGKGRVGHKKKQQQTTGERLLYSKHLTWIHSLNPPPGLSTIIKHLGQGHEITRTRVRTHTCAMLVPMHSNLAARITNIIMLYRASRDCQVSLYSTSFRHTSITTRDLDVTSLLS